MSVYGYIRLNTSVETPEGLGFKEQTQKINAWAADSKLEIKKIHRDKEPTSSSLDLPRLAKLTKQIDQGKVTVLVVVRLDRLTRSIRLYNHLLELLAVNNVRFVSFSRASTRPKNRERWCSTRCASWGAGKPRRSRTEPGR